MNDDIVVTADKNQPSRGRLTLGELDFPCALGKAGVTDCKVEGDHKTPLGIFSLRRVLYRPDKLLPQCCLPLTALRPEDGWCDDSGDKAYNCHVTLPYPARAENLWREDELYDLIVVLGYNDNPVEKGKGSAVFLHIAREDFGGTEGCIALKKEDLLNLLAHLTPDITVKIYR